MSQHERFKQMLARRVELSPQEELDLEQHLRDCPECKDTATVYARQAALLRSLPLAEPPLTLRARVMESIREQPPMRARWPRRPFLLLAPVLAAALVVASLALFNRPHHTNHSAVVISPTRTTRVLQLATPTPQNVTATKPSRPPTPSARRKRVRPTSVPPVPQGVPIPTPLPGVNGPVLSQALPTPAVPAGHPRSGSPSPGPTSGRVPVRQQGRPPTQGPASSGVPVPTGRPSPTQLTSPPGVVPMGGTPPIRILPPNTPVPPTPPTSPAQTGVVVTPVPAAPPAPSPVAAPVPAAPIIATPTPIP